MQAGGRTVDDLWLEPAAVDGPDRATGRAERLAATVHDLPVGLLELDLRGGLVDVNPGWLELVDDRRATQLGTGWLRHLHPSDRTLAMRALRRTRDRAVRVTVDVRVRPRRSSTWTHQRLACSRRRVDGVVDGLLVAVLDLTEDVRLRDELSERIATDPLTGLATRPSIVEHLRVALGAAQRDGLRAGIVFADLDGFKAVNDRFGHSAGDEVLRQVGRRLSAAVRPGDVVGRFGGDEFIVLMQRLEDGEQLDDAAERLHDAVASRGYLVEGEVVHVGVSVGSALAASGMDPEEVVGRADRAMYVDKRAGQGDDGAGQAT